MDTLGAETPCVRRHAGGWSMHLRSDVNQDELLEALEGQGTVLKESPKARVRQAGRWVIKESLSGTWSERLKHLFWPIYYRSAWDAAWFLRASGVAVPRPIAYCQERRFGCLVRTATVNEFLDGYTSVEEHARQLVRSGADAEAIAAFLHRIARAVNGVESCGAYHADLSGKNIFTRGGAQVILIDLDAVKLNTRYGKARRLKNHVQLYDSFCDYWDATLLRPFIDAMAEAVRDKDAWFERVVQEQQARRDKIEAVWEAQGRARD